MVALEEEYLTQRQVQLILHINRVTLYRWVKGGKLTKRGTGHRNFYSRSEVEALISKPKLNK